VRRAFKDGENVGRAKNGKFQPAQIAATVQSEAPGTSAEPEKRIFLIAPTMYMKTKAKSGARSIAPTISMKPLELLGN
jgi:hypothetical protein